MQEHKSVYSTYTHVHIEAVVHTYVHTDSHTYTHRHMYTHIYTNTDIHTYTLTPTLVWAYETALGTYHLAIQLTHTLVWYTALNRI